MNPSPDAGAQAMTDPMPYPPQDPADLRAQAVRDGAEQVMKAHRRHCMAWDRYHRAALRGHAGDLYRQVSDAAQDVQRAIYAWQRVTLDALEAAEVPVIHDRTEGA